MMLRARRNMEGLSLQRSSKELLPGRKPTGNWCTLSDVLQGTLHLKMFFKCGKWGLKYLNLYFVLIWAG